MTPLALFQHYSTLAQRTRKQVRNRTLSKSDRAAYLKASKRFNELADANLEEYNRQANNY